MISRHVPCSPIYPRFSQEGLALACTMSYRWSSQAQPALAAGTQHEGTGCHCDRVGHTNADRTTDKASGLADRAYSHRRDCCSDRSSSLAAICCLDAQGDRDFDLKQQREAESATNKTLSAKNQTLEGQLASTPTNLRETDAKLTKTTEKLEATKKDLREMKGDLAAANERADANYSTGRDAGSEIEQRVGSALVCSDDPDAGLPACGLWP